MIDTSLNRRQGSEGMAMTDIYIMIFFGVALVMDTAMKYVALKLSLSSRYRHLMSRRLSRPGSPERHFGS